VSRSRARLRGLAIALSLWIPAACLAVPGRAAGRGPWIEHFETLVVRDGVVKFGARYVRTLSRIEGSGRPRWRVEVEWPDSSGRSRSRQVSEADGAARFPLWSRVWADRDSAALAVVQGRAIGWVVPVSGPTRLLDLPLPAGTIAPEFEGDAVAALALATGFETSITSLGLTGDLHSRRVRVERADTVTVAGRTRDCWVVALSPRFAADSRLTLWVDRRTRRVWQRRGDYAAFAWIHRATNP